MHCIAVIWRSVANGMPVTARRSHLGEILIQRTSTGNDQKLHATADGQHWQMNLHCSVKDFKFESVSSGIDACAFAIDLTVERWIDIFTAGQQQTR